MGNYFTEAAYQALVGSLSERFPSFGNVGIAAYKPGLERMRALMDALGRPHEKFPCIHVAGTNGKGSTCNMLSAHYAAKGLKVGLYTSPHILDFRERARVVSVPQGVCLVPREYVWDFLQDNLSLFESLGTSYFEITTALAFSWFASCGVDIAVVETGLGGRLDATNIVKPLLSVITNIGYDHMDILGNTLAEIAAEKAGIIKEGCPAVIGESDPATRPVFEKVAQDRHSSLFFAGDKVWDAGSATLGNAGAGSVSLRDLEDARMQLDTTLRQMDLQGSYQCKNLRTVLCSLGVLGEEPRLDAIAHAARLCGFHGRWERIGTDPYTICDIGHNAHGLKYNFSQLDDLLDSGEFSDLVMVYGSVRDKDVDAVLRLLPSRAYIYFTAASGPRALPAGELAERARQIRGSDTGAGEWAACGLPGSGGTGCCGGEVVPGVAEAVSAALRRCSTLRRPLLYIGGSTYVVSEALQAMHICLDE